MWSLLDSFYKVDFILECDGDSVLAHLYESIGSYCCHFQVGMGVGIGVIFERFYDKVFFCGMGNMLSGKLSCRQTGPVILLETNWIFTCDPYKNLSSFEALRSSQIIQFIV